MKPRYTDGHRWPRGYAIADQTNEPGYLAAKFARIRAEQELDRVARADKVAGTIKPKAKGKA